MKIVDPLFDAHEPVCGRWEPIETAPKDGKRIILYVPGMRVDVGYYLLSEHYRNGKLDYRTEKWVIGPSLLTRMGEKDPEPTHWMPLPRLP